MISVIPWKKIIMRFHFCKYGCWNLTTLSNKLHHSFFLLSLVPFFRIGIKNNVWRIARNRLRKLSRYHRGGVKVQDLQWNCKRKYSRPLGKLCCRYFPGVLVYRWTGIKYCGCWVLESWLRQCFWGN